LIDLFAPPKEREPISQLFCSFFSATKRAKQAESFPIEVFFNLSGLTSDDSSIRKQESSIEKAGLGGTAPDLCSIVNLPCISLMKRVYGTIKSVTAAVFALIIEETDVLAHIL
jgi:hypothetical protein